VNEAIAIVIIVLMMAIGYAVERRFAPWVECWRCQGFGTVRRWHLLRSKPCPRCDGTGRRPRWWGR
jgi:hypothetical protein